MSPSNAMYRVEEKKLERWGKDEYWIVNILPDPTDIPIGIRSDGPDDCERKYELMEPVHISLLSTSIW